MEVFFYIFLKNSLFGDLIKNFKVPQVQAFVGKVCSACRTK